MGLDIKRRMWRLNGHRYRIELSGGETTEFAYHPKARPWDPIHLRFREFEPEENQWSLYWEKVHLDDFLREEDIICYLIRFAYNIEDYHLIPSEILTDFGLMYEAGDWVDDWFCSDKHEVVFAEGLIKRPARRNIRFPEFRDRAEVYLAARANLWREKRAQKAQQQLPKIEKEPQIDFEKLERPRIRRREVSIAWKDRSCFDFESRVSFRRRKSEALVDLPDEECFFVLKSGESASEDPEKQNLDLAK